MASSTKEMLAKALKELLNNNTIDNITVQNIADNAYVSRKTFYYHFKDMYDLLEWTLQQDAEAVIAGNTTIDTWQKGLINIFSYCEENNKLIFNIYHSVRREILEGYVCKAVKPVVWEIMQGEPNYEGLAKEDIEFIIEFYALGITGLFMKWVGDEMKTEPELIVAKLEQFFCGSLKNLIEKAK